MELEEINKKIEELNDKRNSFDEEIDILQREKEALIAKDFLEGLKGTEWVVSNFGAHSMSCYGKDADKVYKSGMNIWPHGSIAISKDMTLRCDDSELKISVSPCTKSYNDAAKKQTKNMYLIILVEFAIKYGIKLSLRHYKEEIETCQRKIKNLNADMELINQLMKGK